MDAIICETRAILCPTCDAHTFHIAVGGVSFSPIVARDCAVCGGTWSFTIHSPESITMDSIGRLIPTRHLLRTGDGATVTYYVRDGFIPRGMGEPQFAALEVHMHARVICPKDVLGGGTVVHLGDTDPHGLVTYVGYELRDSWDEELDDDQILAFIDRVETVFATRDDDDTGIPVSESGDTFDSLFGGDAVWADGRFILGMLSNSLELKVGEVMDEEAKTSFQVYLALKDDYYEQIPDSVKPVFKTQTDKTMAWVFEQVTRLMPSAQWAFADETPEEVMRHVLNKIVSGADEGGLMKVASLQSVFVKNMGL